MKHCIRNEPGRPFTRDRGKDDPPEATAMTTATYPDWLDALAGLAHDRRWLDLMLDTKIRLAPATGPRPG